MSKIVPPDVWNPAKYDVADVAAVQELAKGTATPDQQKRALNWVIHNAALTYDLEYRTDQRDHAFASGRRYVGLQLVALLRIDVAKLRVALTPPTPVRKHGRS